MLKHIKYAIVRMWKKLYHKPVHLIVSFFQPIFWLTIFGYLFQSKFSFTEGNYLSFLLPGVLAMTVLQSSAQSGISIIKDIQSGFFGRYNLISNVKIDFIFSKIFADFTRILSQVIIIFLLGILMSIPLISVSFNDVLISVLSIFLFTFFYSSVSSLIAVITKTTESMATFVHLFNLPLVFTSTALIPVKNLPGWMSFLVEYNPLSFLSNVLRDAIIYHKFTYWDYMYYILGLLFLALFSFSLLVIKVKKLSYD